MNPEPFLSFCIPTYNQPERVGQLLQSLEKEIAPDTEIVIRDDSTDELTAEIVAKSPIRERIRYFHGKKEGFDLAALFLVKEARGKYVWWFGDDILRPGGFTKVKRTLEVNPSITFLFINSANTNDPDHPSLSFKEDFFFRNREQVITNLGDLLAFPSGTVFMREKAMKGIDEAHKYVGKSFMSLYISLQVLSEEGSFYFFHEPCILTEPKLPTTQPWYDVFQLYGANYPEVVGSFRGKFEERALRKMLKTTFRSVWRSILVYRAQGYTTGFGSASPKIGPLFRHYRTFAEFWLVLPFLLLPRPLIRALYRIYKLFFPQTTSRFPSVLE